MRIDPLAHSALPDAEAIVIRNLMERIGVLKSELTRLQSCLREVAAGRPLSEPCGWRSQSLRDREILEFLGESKGPLSPGSRPVGGSPSPEQPSTAWEKGNSVDTAPTRNRTDELSARNQ